MDKSSNNRSMLWTASISVMLKIGPVRLALVGLTAGCHSGRWKSCFRNFSKSNNTTPDMSLVRLYQYVSGQFFCDTIVLRWFFAAHFWEAIVFWQSLLLSTTILNDTFKLFSQCSLVLSLDHLFYSTTTQYKRWPSNKAKEYCKNKLKVYILYQLSLGYK